ERSATRPRFSASRSGPGSGSLTRTLVASGVSIDAPKAAVPPLKVGHGLKEVPPPEIGPQEIGDPELRIGYLPEQEIGEPHFAARADQEIGIGETRRIEVGLERRLVDSNAGLGPGLVDEPLHCVHQLRPSTVRESEKERQAAMMVQALHGPGDHLADGGIQLLGPADEPEAHPALVEVVDLLVQGAHEEAHEPLHLATGTLPV